MLPQILLSPQAVNQSIKNSLMLSRRESDLFPRIVCAYLYAGGYVHTGTTYTYAYIDIELNGIYKNYGLFNLIIQF